MGDKLLDSKINHVQRLLQARHPGINGLRLILYKGKLSNVVNSVQIVHCLRVWLDITGSPQLL